MTLDEKITIRGILQERGHNPRLSVAASAADLCFFWRVCCGRPITEYEKSKNH